MTVTGLELAVAKLNKEIKRIEGVTAKGIEAAAVFIKGEAQQLAPIHDGVLRNSAYTRMTGPMAAEIGFTAEYAAYIHEIPVMISKGKPRPKRNGIPQGFYWQDGENKFLEKAVVRNMREIVQIIARRAAK